MRIVDAKNDNNESAAWIIYGICKKCNIVMISELFLQEEKPLQDIDFIIDYQKKSNKGKEWKH